MATSSLAGCAGAAKPLRLIALTGYGRETDRTQTRAAGFDHHMVKPIDIAGLDTALRSLSARPDDALA